MFSSTTQCIALTKKGTQCKNKPIKGSQHCQNHQLASNESISNESISNESISTQKLPIASKQPIMKKVIVAKSSPQQETIPEPPKPSSESISQPKPTPEPISQPKPTSEPISQPKPTSEPISQPKPTPEPISQPKSSDPFEGGYDPIIDRISYSPGHKFKDITLISDDDGDNWPHLTSEDLDKQVFPGQQVSFKYPYIDAEDDEEALAGFWYTFTTGTTLREVLAPLVIWGLSFETDACMFFEGFSRSSSNAPWEPHWGS